MTAGERIKLLFASRRGGLVSLEEIVDAVAERNAGSPHPDSVKLWRYLLQDVGTAAYEVYREQTLLPEFRQQVTEQLQQQIRQNEIYLFPAPQQELSHDQIQDTLQNYIDNEISAWTRRTIFSRSIVWIDENAAQMILRKCFEQPTELNGWDDASLRHWAYGTAVAHAEVQRKQLSRTSNKKHFDQMDRILSEQKGLAIADAARQILTQHYPDLEGVSLSRKIHSLRSAYVTFLKESGQQ